MLPWKLAALADWDQDRARLAAKESLAMFDSVGHQCELHHRISWYWLNPRSAVRVDVEAFANGADPHTPRVGGFMELMS